MSSTKERNNRIQRIDKAVEKILGYDLESDLIRDQYLGKEYTFSVIKKQLYDIVKITTDIVGFDTITLPFQQLDELANVLETIGDQFDRIVAFKSTESNAPNIRNQYINSIESAYDSLLYAIQPILLLKTVYKTADENINEKENIISKLNSLKFEGEEKIEQINQILEKSKAATGEVGINVHSKLFQEESLFHKGEAEKWLSYVWRAIGIIIIAGLVLFFIKPDLENLSAVIQFSITKVIILAALFYALSICMKNYRAHKHNEIVNKHRQNALSTFETFVKSTTDDQTKNAVLLQATMSIFSNQQTGYSTSDNDGDMPSKVIEIIKSASPASKQS